VLDTGARGATTTFANRAIGDTQVSTKRPLVAVLSGVTRKEFPTSFMKGMRELGYVEGGNIDVAYRFADGHLDLLPTLAEELIQFRPEVIIAAITPAAVTVRRLTQTIPIVCPLLANPIDFGLIASMSRPGGNVTGVMFRIDDLAGKQLELAAQLVSTLTRVGLIVNVVSGVVVDRQEAERAGERLGIKLVSAEVREQNRPRYSISSIVERACAGGHRACRRHVLPGEETHRPTRHKCTAASRL
jgi:putative ABC transport system substrate-binding protein